MNVIAYKYSNNVQILKKVQVMKYKYFPSLVNSKWEPVSRCIQMRSEYILADFRWGL